MQTTNKMPFFDFIKESLSKIETLKFTDLTEHTIIFVVDMVNGFTKKGNLVSTNIYALIKPIKTLLNTAISHNTKIIAFNDAHNEHSPEFAAYGQHCLEEDIESQLVTELAFPAIKIINKNSTNGFFAFNFKPNLQWNNIIIVGCCTDICIYQLALSCKTWFNQHNKEVNVIVPMNMTDTFDNDEHPATLMNEWAWYSMLKNGIKIVKDIT